MADTPMELQEAERADPSAQTLAKNLESAADLAAVEAQEAEILASAKESKFSDIASLDEAPLWLQKQVKDLRKEAENYRTQLREQQLSAQNAEEERLIEQNKYKELYERERTRTEQLKAEAEQATALTEIVLQIAEAEMKDWPEEVLALADDTVKGNPVAMMRFVQQSQPLVKRLQHKARSAIPASPNQPNLEQSPEVEEAAKAYSMRFYNNF